eukprot:7162371-Pyramimonas_sp.AAC.1
MEEANQAIKASNEKTKRLQEKLKATAKSAPPLFKLQPDELSTKDLIKAVMTADAGKGLDDDNILAPLVIKSPPEWKQASEQPVLA